MRLCWKIFLPLAFAFVIYIFSIIFIFNGLV
jgi:NADH:ubiquinone oxidoreductase subunit H